MIPISLAGAIFMNENLRERAVEVEDLSKIYDSLVAVDNISFAMDRGEAFGFLGPNGAGKSTVVKILTGLVAPTRGKVRVLGNPVGHLETRRRVGYLPELPTFHRWLRAKEFLDFHGRLCGLRGIFLEKRIKETLAEVGMTGRENQKLGTFSKGMLQRIGLAQALLNQPDLLILDELVSGLDPVGVRDMRELLRHLKMEGMSIFLNSHQLADVEVVCDRVAIINQGRILKVGAPAALFKGPTVLEIRVDQVNAELLHYLCSIALSVECNERDPNSVLVEVRDEQEAAATVASVVHACGRSLYSLAPRRHSLEQLFLQTIDASSN